MDTPKTDALDKAPTDRETETPDVPAQVVVDPETRDEDGFTDDLEEDDDASAEDGSDAEPAGTRGAPGLAAAAASVVAVGLGLSSLTGTWIGDLMQDREQLIGNIKSSGGTPHAQLAAAYGTPWHTVALFNGIFAVVAILVAAVVLFRPGRPATAGNHWSQALAWGGLILGVLGLLIAGVMWFDVFTDLPLLPATSAS
ncbi:hypothetical protein [Streptomyces sp. H39-S7]|uniref:hypothetical protein n=1 Tax=Streptomyces sp. H39-S7 TaxID=3004357 RepID=UPI0022B04438|nr:hypothetical protein [Streptomyces sp. H39-S7]MCZ4121511.1 hypothetical protein [Streptomyces sp. H39-S7]